MISETVSTSIVAPSGLPASGKSGTERRAHLKVYQVWSELNGESGLPSASDILAHPGFTYSANAVLIEIDENCSGQITAIGSNIALPQARLPMPLDAVPGRSLVSRLTDHVLEPLANRTPIGFEADFIDENGQELSYRAIAMPCADDGIHIDTVLGVITYKVRSEVPDPKPPAGAQPPAQAKSVAGTPPPPKPRDPKGFGRKASGPEQPVKAVDEEDPYDPIAEIRGQIAKIDKDERREAIMNYKEKLKECMEIDGAIAVALFDLESGMPIATEQSNKKSLDLEVAAAGNTNVLRAKYETMKQLGIDEKIEDILITLDTQIHMIRPATSESGQGLIVYLAVDKSKANLAMARLKLRQIEQGLEV